MQQKFLLLLLFSLASSAILSSCSEEDTGSTCAPLAASAFPCTDPNECLSVTATWCYAGASNCSDIDVDLELEFPTDAFPAGQSPIINSSNATAAFPLYGCIHDGDETADTPVSSQGIFGGPYDENITCGPYVHPDPPERMDPGTYQAIIQENSIVNTDVRLDINVNGQTSCQFITTADIGQPPVKVQIDYP